MASRTSKMWGWKKVQPLNLGIKTYATSVKGNQQKTQRIWIAATIEFY